MRVVIDLQAAQGLSRFRGIGRYSVALARAMVRQRGEHEVLIALNGMLADSIDDIRAAFDGLLPQDNIRVWQAVGPVNAVDPDNRPRRKAAELIREAYLAQLEPDIVHVASLFEGYQDDAVYSAGSKPPRFATAATFYDLIPLLNPAKYLDPNPSYNAFYTERLAHLRAADIFLAISDFSRQELIDHLSVGPDRAVNISAAADDCFHKIDLSPADAAGVRKAFGLIKPFVMYSGATDERKNHLRLIEAFAQLPKPLRRGLQLALVGAMSPADLDRFTAHAKTCGLGDKDMVITGKVTDREMNHLYNLCEVFAFPSWHEGFGLPALEAMRCGAPVIASNTTSLPEVVGRLDTLFDPFDPSAIAAALQRVLESAPLKADLSAHGLERAKAFSWDQTARRAWDAFEALQARRLSSPRPVATAPAKPTLAFVSPLPPQRTGIADYSADLLPVLTNHYAITAITDQTDFDRDWRAAGVDVQDVAWLRENADRFDRILYHFGNSPFHEPMFDLIQEVSGVVVLHDFFLSSAIAYLDTSGARPGFFASSLYDAHGYGALADLAETNGWDDARLRYPCNAEVIRAARGVIVHSRAAQAMAADWLGDKEARRWTVIPLLRDGRLDRTREAARRRLGIPADAFVVCSFGLIDPTKQSDKLLSAWLGSALSDDPRAHLVFVGEQHGGDYGRAIDEKIRKSQARVAVTGYVAAETYTDYLAAADVGVQLRTSSRGETSKAVLDCMTWGLATIVNANGAMAELPADAVTMLPDAFTQADLIHALTQLQRDPVLSAERGAAARQALLRRNDPATCARLYAEAIERDYGRGPALDDLVASLRGLGQAPIRPDEAVRLAAAVAQNQPPRWPRQMFIDVSAHVKTDLKTGVERVVRNITAELLRRPPDGFRVEPVYADERHDGYRYARKFTADFLKAPSDGLEDDLIEYAAGDVFLGLDLQQDVVARQAGAYQTLRRFGVGVYFVVHDLLPVQMPEMFPEGAAQLHRAWLETIQEADGLIGVSRAVADDLSVWLHKFGGARKRPLKLGWFHLGAAAPAHRSQPMSSASAPTPKPDATFILVGTLEPRKGHLQTLDAFDTLWAQGLNLHLEIVGREGWKGLPEANRRTIPAIVARLRRHPELGVRLFWRNDLDDAGLDQLYAEADAMIMASQGEGFGLPLIEAARYGLGVIARDLPVFREVGGDQPIVYFSGQGPDALAQAVLTWLNTRARLDPDRAWKTWDASAEQLKGVIFDGKWMGSWEGPPPP
jgi:glycosyltransferase involved in cell wall biosynthesis